MIELIITQQDTILLENEGQLNALRWQEFSIAGSEKCGVWQVERGQS